MDLVRRAALLAVTNLALAFGSHASIATPADPPTYCGTNSWQSTIADAAHRFDLPPAWIDAVIRIESAGCIVTGGRPTTSDVGALGLMQLMPDVWERFRESFHLGSDPHAPHDNIVAGAAYLRELYDRYGTPGCFIAYHAGPKRYEEYLAERRPLPRQSLDYLIQLQRITPVPGARTVVASAQPNASGTIVNTESAHRAPVQREGIPSSGDRSPNRSIRSPIFVTLTHRDRVQSDATQSSDWQHE